MTDVPKPLEHDNFDFGNINDNNNNDQNNNTKIETKNEIPVNENLLKYTEIIYTDKDRLNLIKKIELYLNDPELKKIASRKIHLREYLCKTKLVKMDGKTLNWIYDELKNFDITEGLGDAMMSTYISINNIIEASLCKMNIDVEGYSDTLDNNYNRILIKQIAIDNFNYLEGSMKPEVMLLIMTGQSLSGAYKTNKKKKNNNNNEIIIIEKEEIEQEKKITQHKIDNIKNFIRTPDEL